MTYVKSTYVHVWQCDHSCAFFRDFGLFSFLFHHDLYKFQGLTHWQLSSTETVKICPEFHAFYITSVERNRKLCYSLKGFFSWQAVEDNPSLLIECCLFSHILALMIKLYTKVMQWLFRYFPELSNVYMPIFRTHNFSFNCMVWRRFYWIGDYYTKVNELKIITRILLSVFSWLT